MASWQPPGARPPPWWRRPWPQSALGRLGVALGAGVVLCLLGAAAFGLGVVVDRVVSGGGPDRSPVSVADRRSPNATPSLPSQSPTPAPAAPSSTAPPVSGASGATPAADRTPSPATPSATPTAPATPTPTVTPPAITTLVVCDGTVDCGVGPAGLPSDRVITCLQVRSGPGGAAPTLTLVASRQSTAPTGPTDPAIVARSQPVPAAPDLRCYAVTTAAGALPPGSYWLWVLEGTVARASRPFVVPPRP